MSDTPDTDEAQFGTGTVSVSFARRLERERNELRAWKAEAMEVLAGWEKVWEAAGQPGLLGHLKSTAVRKKLNAMWGHER